MMKWLALLAVVVLLSGCVGQPANQAGSSGNTPTGAAIAAASAGVAVLTAPAKVVENTRFPVTWKVSTPDASAITETVLYYDRLSHAGAAPTAMQPSMLKYASVTPKQKGTVPATFTDYVAPGAAAGDTTGKIYFRAYALVGGLNYWSDEYAVEVAPKPAVSITEYPKSTGKSNTFTVKWGLKNGYPGKIGKTYVLYGVRDGEYASSTEAQAGSTPQSFEALLTAPKTAPETVYFIVASTVDGVSFNSTVMTLTVS